MLFPKRHKPQSMHKIIFVKLGDMEKRMFTLWQMLSQKFYGNYLKLRNKYSNSVFKNCPNIPT